MKKRHEWNIDVLVMIFLLLSLLIASSASAEQLAAETKVRTVFAQIEQSLKQLKNENNFQHSTVKQLLSEQLLPEVDAKYFTYKVLAKHLAQLNEQQKLAFIDALSAQLINTYTHLLTKYNNESIVIERSALSKSGKLAMVNINIIGLEKSNKAVVKLLQSEQSNWLFFDIVIEGISLLDSKHKEVSASIARKGVDETLALLVKKH